ncbi:MAG: YggS family pyridoxal phosphate enzyme [Deltaproteobacteria bacterium RIFCSPHIGHO2_12_FULL_43_9]|nr:MAG: YggS family pyridoxal phosphate enzyme [Deltaproteobacteria bacterium RIFCSPHIGHO2_12_FULL_43_9]
MAETVKGRLYKIREEINAACKRAGRDPSSVKILGASKFQPIAVMLEAYEAGLRCFGENRAQELIEKREKLPPDIEWHFIGTLQRRKVSKIVPFVSCIHSLDSRELAVEINKVALETKKRVNCLIEINIDKEESKGGIDPEALGPFLEFVRSFNGIQVQGLMSIPAPMNPGRDSFRKLKLLSGLVKEKLDISHIELSMGMSHDFIEAVEEGSTIVRIGEALFGPRKR